MFKDWRDLESLCRRRFVWFFTTISRSPAIWRGISFFSPRCTASWPELLHEEHRQLLDTVLQNMRWYTEQQESYLRLPKPSSTSHHPTLCSHRYDGRLCPCCADTSTAEVEKILMVALHKCVVSEPGLSEPELITSPRIWEVCLRPPAISQNQYTRHRFNLRLIVRKVPR